MCFFEKEFLEHINIGYLWLHFCDKDRPVTQYVGYKVVHLVIIKGGRKTRGSVKMVMFVFPGSLGPNWFKSITTPKSPDSMRGVHSYLCFL